MHEKNANRMKRRMLLPNQYIETFGYLEMKDVRDGLR